MQTCFTICRISVQIKAVDFSFSDPSSAMLYKETSDLLDSKVFF